MLLLLQPCTQGQAGLSLVATSPRDVPKATPGRVSRVAQLGGHCWMGTESALTELAELTSTCLAGQGLKLGLRGQNLANELMAIN